MEGQHVTSSFSVGLDVEWGCSLIAGTCRQLYHCIYMPNCTMGYRHYLPQSLLDGCVLWFHSWLHQQTAHHMGCFLSANLYNISSLSLPTASVMEAFSAPSDLVGCWLAVQELWHLACQWPFLEQPLQMAFHTGQWSWPRECEWVQLGHCGVHFCGLFFWGQWPWQRTWMALLAHIAAALDSMA